jgi:hypothetical protein
VTRLDNVGFVVICFGSPAVGLLEINAYKVCRLATDILHFMNHCLIPTRCTFGRMSPRCLEAYQQHRALVEVVGVQHQIDTGL